MNNRNKRLIDRFIADATDRIYRAKRGNDDLTRQALGLKQYTSAK